MTDGITTPAAGGQALAKNTNCLEGVRCPDCGNEDRLLIVATVLAEVTDDGSDLASPEYGYGFEWDDDSPTHCPECDRVGPLKEFRIAEADRLAGEA